MEEKLRRLAAQLSGVPVAEVQVTLRQPLEHQSNRLYDVGAGGAHWIAKLYLKPEEYGTAPYHEYGALRLLQPLDIAPRPIHREPPAEAHGPVVIYEFMEGEMWDRHSPTADELGKLADVWLKMNAVEQDGLWLSRGAERPLAEIMARFDASFQGYAAWAEKEFPAAKDAAALCLEVWHRRRSEAATFREVLHDPSQVLCFCRADPRFANVIRRPDERVGLIDWEDCGLRDPARDLGDVLTHPNQEDLVSWQQWQAFLKPYLAERSRFDARLAHRMHYYLAIFPLFWMSIIINRQLQQSDAETVNELAASERVRRYLARSMAWPDGDFDAILKSLDGLVVFV